MPVRIRRHVDFTGCPPAKRATPVPEQERKYKRGVSWDEPEKRKLIDLCERMTIGQASAYFPNRTYGAVSHMASIMNLKGKKP